DLTHVVQAAGERLDPRRGALQPVGRPDVVHDEPIDVTDQRLGVEVAGQQLRVLWGHPAVATDVQVPALFGGDDAHVLGARFGAFPRAARDPHFDLVWRPQTAVAQLEV